MDDVEGEKLYRDATNLIANGHYVKALEILEDLLSVYWEANDSWLLHMEQGEIFLRLSERAEDQDPDLEIAYLLGSVACLSEDVNLSDVCAQALCVLAGMLGSVLYYKMSVEKAKQDFSVTHQQGNSLVSMCYGELKNKRNKIVEEIMTDAEFKIAASKTCPLEKYEPKVRELKKSPEPYEDKFKELRSYWVGLDVRTKRDFMKVSIAKLLSFVEVVYKRNVRDTLERVLSSAREDKKWSFWMCRTKCSKELSSEVECKNHLEQQHAADFKPSEHDLVKRIGKAWAGKISVGGWEPIDAVAADEMIKNQLADVKAFASKSKNGWSEWPLAADEERGKLLKEIKLLLMSLCKKKILACSIRDWVMDFPVKHLGKLEVSKQSLMDSHLVETPQSICFLECHELNQILDFLKSIKCERNDSTDVVCRVVDSILDSTQVKEKIDFDPQFSFLLLDKRLLKRSNSLDKSLLKRSDVPFDGEETINIFDPNVHYGKAHVQGDDIISWLTECISLDKIFPRTIREHNLDIWMAVLRALQFTCRTLETKYAKKMQVLHYVSALTLVMIICMREDDDRSKKEDHWNRYASLLCDKCVKKAPIYSYARKLFVCAVRDVLTGALHPTFGYPDYEDCMNLIRERKSLSDDVVLESIDILKSAIIQKVLLIDSKILLIDNSRMSLLDKLTRLSFFDSRTYILQLLKPFLLKEIVYMDSKAKSEAAVADLLLQENKKSLPKKKKKANRSS